MITILSRIFFTFFALILFQLAACSKQNESSLDRLPACGNETTLFDHSPMNYNDIRGIVPLGNLNPPGHTFPTDHLYFYIVMDGGFPKSSSVYSPGDVTVVEISSLDHITSGSTAYTDYQVTFSSCRDFYMYYGHVQEISPLLRQELEAARQRGSYSCNNYSTDGSEYRYCNYYGLQVPLQSGEYIGTAGREGQYALDVGAVDYRIQPHHFIHQEKYRKDQLYTVCPLDYFSSPTKENLYSLLGSYDGSLSRTIEPRCGEFEQDEPGTAQGNWFLQGTSVLENEDIHIALVHDNVNPEIAAFSVGTSLKGVDPGVYTFSPLHQGLVNRDFNEITSTGNIYCFYDISWGGRFLLELVDEETLKIEYQASTDCNTQLFSFGSNFVTYER